MKKLLNPIYFFGLFYLFFASLNLTLLPIFNDESIYLDWADRSVNVPGKLYYSLYDGKTPLQLWLFGISEKFFSDPLFAGRIVSVFLGAVTLAGIYLLVSKFINKKTAFFSAIIYIFTPIIFFYNRQTLMESGVGAAGIWTIYFFLMLLRRRETKYAILTGVVAGIGFFIKTNSLLFLIAIFLVEASNFYKNKNATILRRFGIIILSFSLTILLLLINPQFWGTLTMNSRYGFSPIEILHFPLVNWVNNTFVNISILFVFVTPLIFLLIISGIFFAWKKYRALISLTLIPLTLQTLLVKVPQQRYIVSFIPMLIVFAGFAVFRIYSRNKLLGFTLLAVSVVLPAILIFYQIFSPELYFSSTRHFSTATETSYIEGPLSGYGVASLIKKIDGVGDKKMLITFAQNAGNPENAINIYFKNRKNIQAGYLEASFLGPTLANYNCVKDKSGRPIYFISRSNYLAGLEKYLQIVEKLPIPSSNEFIGIFKMKDNCTDEKTLFVDPVMAP